MEMSTLFAGIYRGKRVLLTGHTGFKGSWMALWLTEMGATVKGISLPGNAPDSHWEQLALNSVDDARIDIRDQDKLKTAIDDFSPDIVFHLAAQSLVRKGYADPLGTWDTNVMGTANILEACRASASVRAVVIVTTDKCYENQEWVWGYRENDRLGGHDPYSASKAAVELLVSSYRKSFFGQSGAPLIATARAGNVIGGGDWSEDRLIPDVVKSHMQGTSANIRSPFSTRPWQHVLESLSAYLLLGQRLLENEAAFAESWNFGPGAEGNRKVLDVLNHLKASWPSLKWTVSTNEGPHEANLLQLDCSKALLLMNWKPVWNLHRCLAQTAKWYRHWQEHSEPISVQQLRDYVSEAAQTNAIWCD